MATPQPRPQPYPAHAELLARWADLLTEARGGAADPDPLPYGENLLARWGEPHRHYHTTAHLLAVLDHIDLLEAHSRDAPPTAPGTPDAQAAPATPDAQAAPAPDLAAARLAAWFHDAVYLPERSTNEEAGARLAERALTEAGVPAPRVREVCRLILLTVDHDPRPGDIAGELLCDADLAVLAGSPQQYASYAAAVRQEYGFVPDEAFREGRSAVLRHLLGLPRLYRTPYGREHWERTARFNLSTELELLTAAG
ncbi:hypothetical protein [Streptomyces sp. NPDC018031]|uniref:hypothetical protein n=1 Tax=Streptomyces sp. NPDC018031 TaxID=3365033 RepID=UPI00378C2325